MARTSRSKNYPALGLGEVIDRARRLYEQDKTAPVSTEVAVKAWGYTGLNGASLRVLGAGRHFGMLDSPEAKTVKLSHRALTILLEPEGSAERIAALKAAAAEPAMFGEIKAQYGDALPSDGAMVSWLVRNHGFGDGAARALIASYRDTKALVEKATRGDIASSTGADDAPPSEAESPARRPPAATKPRGGDSTGGPFMEFTWPLSGSATATLVVTKQLDADDINTLDDYFKIAKKALAKAARATAAQVENQSAPDLESEAD